MSNCCLSKTKFYRTYKSILYRCNSSRSKRFYCYGAKGIKCEWKTFDEFKKDMYKTYKVHSKKHGDDDTTIERINVYGNYNKDNCRWATKFEQGSNKTINRVITFKGKTHHLAQWARILNINSTTLQTRLDVLGWNIKDSFRKPVRKTIVKYNNKYIRLAELSRITGLKEKTLSNRIHIYGWSVKKSVTTPLRNKITSLPSSQF